MFKLVVLCAFFAAAAAKPGALLYSTPLTQYSTFVEPGTTTILQHDNSVIHPSSIGYYSAPFTYSHLIKKRSAAWTAAPYAAIPYAAPTTLVHNAPIWPGVSQYSSAYTPFATNLHYIKKRSAQFVPTTYSYTAAAAPILPNSYSPLVSSTHLIPSTSLISQPFAYTHLIKKRSAPLLNTYVAPTAYSHQSRFDLHSTHTPLTSIAYSSPIAYTSQYGYSHVY